MNKDIIKLKNQAAADSLTAFLHDNKYLHLNVRVWGKHIIVYSKDPGGGQDNRARLSHLSSDIYKLSISNHMDKWEDTYITGTLNEMQQLLTEQFCFVLDDY